MDIELLKLVLSKSSSVDEARRFLVDFTDSTRQEIKQTELATYFGGIDLSQPAKPAKPAKLTTEKRFTKASTQENAPAMAGRRWAPQEVANLACVLCDLGTTPPDFDVLGAQFHRSAQDVSAMSALILYFSIGGIQPTWTVATKNLFTLAFAQLNWPVGRIHDLHDWRKRTNTVKRKAI